MKFILNAFLFSLVLLSFWSKTYALNDYQIKKICQNSRRKSTCIKNLKEKRSDLQKGKLIEIPVKPYKQ